jgi:hypothetical protein
VAALAVSLSLVPAATTANSADAPTAPTSATSGHAPADRVAALQQRCRTLPWCTPSFSAWELLLAVQQRRLPEAQALAELLMGIQVRDGKWGLGTDWGRTDYDFKSRTAADAESWEVAEVGLALVRYASAAHDRRGIAAARRAADYLHDHVVRVHGRPYLAHMPECNNRLQPQSTIAAAALLDNFARYRSLADRLRRSGKAMQDRRIVPGPGQTSLAHARWGPAINDYERAQIAYYLSLMGDPDGSRWLHRHPPGAQTDFYRAQPYLVMVDLLSGHPHRARRRAAAASFVPLHGYDIALADWIRVAQQH